MKELLQIPISMSQLFYAKILFLFLTAVIIMLLNCLLIIISAVICKVTDISAYQTLMLIRFFLTIALSMPFAMFPVFLITALTSGNTIFQVQFALSIRWQEQSEFHTWQGHIPYPVC